MDASLINVYFSFLEFGTEYAVSNKDNGNNV